MMKSQFQEYIGSLNIDREVDIWRSNRMIQV